ncbi:hypothetical protein RBU49_06540 [Clostridium sp. MB40-C1]|uniref:HMA2 domain-containing protein n=1 Tax=Clostridium sp. MB40-C1 TaxID=3070996 RepID=UPI0027E14886|nr:hypothetical protein [Clostridium sp. MB40-C1]WMJ81900.1 hypothetical protein RBU49_06540 [Clostridium sp. MB40-C1]
MINIQKYILRHVAKVKIIHSMPGRIRLKVPNLNKVPEEFRNYDKFFIKAIRILDGIEDISMNYLIGTTLITYNSKVVYEEKIMRWIKIIIDIGINNIIFIHQYGESNLEHVVSTLEQQLKEEVAKL